MKVNHDFKEKYQNANDGLAIYWTDFFKTNISTLVEIINDPDIKQSLKDNIALDGKWFSYTMLLFLRRLSTDTCYQNVQLAKALHGAAIPSTVALGNKRWKPSIESSQDCFFKYTLNRETMEKDLKLNLTNCDKKNIQYHPLIFGIGDIKGDTQNISEYVVAISDVYYTFPTFIQAMDGAFKCYIFFKIAFPPQVIRFWSLINAIFYKIQNIDLKLTPTLSSIIRSLNKL